MQISIKKWGNSAGVRIPAPILEAAHLAVDSAVDIEEQGGVIIIRPVVAKRYDVEALVAGITPENRHAEVSSGGAVGKELL